MALSNPPPPGPNELGKGKPSPPQPLKAPIQPGRGGVKATGPVRAVPGAPQKTAPKPRKRVIDLLKSKVGTFLFQLISLAVFLTALGIWGFQQVMKQVVGRFDLFDWQSAAVTLYGAPSILIIDPVRTEEFLRPDTTVWDTLWRYSHRFDTWPLKDTLWYAGEMKRPKAGGFEAWQLLGTPDTRNMVRLADYWKELFFQNKISYQLMEEPALTAIPEDINMLVLPGCLLLSNEEKLGIKRFVAKGGKLLACWSVGVRDENGDWVGFDFLQQMVGGLLSDQAVDPAGGTAVILSGAGPITAMLPPGQHIEFWTYNGFVGLNIIEARTVSDGWWFKPYWKYGGTDAISRASFLAHGSYVAGKFVWFSFTPDAIQPHKDNNLIVPKLILNSINWLSGKPLVDIRIWPGGHSAAGALLVEATSSPESMNRLASAIRSSGREFDVMINPEVVADRFSLGPDDYADLIMVGTDTSMLNNDNVHQFDWMEKGIARLEQVAGKRPIGVAAPDWGYGDVLGLAAARNDIRYLLGDPMPRFYGPKDKIIRVSGFWIFAAYANLAGIPKCQVSPEEWVVYGDVHGEGAIMNAMAQDLRRVRRSQGLYTAILNPSSLDEAGAGAIASRIPALMDSMGVWMAPMHTLVERMVGWEGLRVAAFEVSPTRLRLEISNESDVLMRDVVFEIYLAPHVIKSVEVNSEIIGFRPGNVLWNGRAGICTFTVPEIASGINAALFLDLNASTTREIIESEEPALDDTTHIKSPEPTL